MHLLPSLPLLVRHPSSTRELALLLLLAVFPSSTTCYSLSFSAASSMPPPRTTRTAAATNTGALLVRVVSYNVLSSLLAPNFSPELPLENLDASTRLARILAKLDREITTTISTTNSTNSNTEDLTTTPRRPIFCLQEVSYDWAGAMHTFFGQRGYHVITGLYGKPYNGYMGVLTAFPTDAFQVEDVDISRLSDTATFSWPEVPKESSIVGRLIGMVQKPLKLLLLAGQDDDNNNSSNNYDHWDTAKRRFNVLVQARLRDRTTRTEFCIANYHMPCCYYAPKVMTIQADLCLKHVQTMAARTATKDKDNNDDDDNDENSGRRRMLPYILAGDFNIKPNEPVYKLLTTGVVMDTADPFYPTTPPHHDAAPDNEHSEWKPTMVESVRSAYAAAVHKNNGSSEPDFTNYAPRIGVQDDDDDDAPCFIDTLDYIFVSNRGITVRDVLQLPHRTQVTDGPFPNAHEPSDHIMIAANLEIHNHHDDDGD